jgi:uncharacterized protein YjbI with pentapeptide repeats
MLWRQIWGALKSIEVIIAVAIFFVALLLINGLTLILPADNKYYSDTSFLDNMLANANTMIFDIAVVLVLNTFLLKIAERRSKIQDYFDEIDDFRGWDSEEASHRIRGIIFRLNKLGVTKIELNRCFLYCANLNAADFRGTNLSYADLQRADIMKANLSGANLECANLSGANLGGANFSGAYLFNANLTGSDLSAADLSEANLSEAYLNGADLHLANLNGAKLNGADLNVANLSMSNLEGADLEGADLKRADLLLTNLTKTDLHWAKLTGADLRGAKLRGVKNILKADGLDSVDFTDAIMDDETREFLSKINPTVKPLEKSTKENGGSDKIA